MAHYHNSVLLYVQLFLSQLSSSTNPYPQSRNSHVLQLHQPITSFASRVKMENTFLNKHSCSCHKSTVQQEYELVWCKHKKINFLIEFLTCMFEARQTVQTKTLIPVHVVLKHQPVQTRHSHKMVYYTGHMPVAVGWW